MTPQFTAIVVEQPTDEPISLEDAREHLRVTPYIPTSDGLAHPDDLLIKAKLTAAREFCENFTGVSLVAKTYEIAGDHFPDNRKELELLHPPLISVEEVRYGDASADVIDPALVKANVWRTPQTIFLDGDWPSIEAAPARVRVRYRAGYRSAAADSSETAQPLPFAFRAAILLTLGHLYENREATTIQALKELPLGVESILRPLRVRKGLA